MKNKISTCILVFALLFPFLNKAQTNCATSQIVLPNSSLLDLNINQTYISGDDINWYKIPVSKDSIDINIISSVDSFFYKAYKIEVFSGNCSNLNLLKVDSLSNLNDSTLNISLNNLTFNDSLYLKISLDKNYGCNLCLFKSAAFKVIVHYINSPQWECLTCTTMTGCNLVCNGDFEQHLGLFSTLNNISDACGWDDLTNSTCDYFNTSIVSWSDVSAPCNKLGYEVPHSGQGYAGFLGVGTNTDSNAPNGWNEYMKTRLLSPLLPGQSYTLTCWISMAEASRIQGNTIGAYFYENLNGVNTNIVTPISVSPQITFTVTGLSSNGWTQYTGNFTPTTTGIEWLAIGAFTTNYSARACNSSCTNTQCAWNSYFFIDDVSLIGPQIFNETTIPSCPGKSTTLTSTLPQPLNWANSNWGVSTQTTQSINVSAATTYYAYSTNNPNACKQVEVFHVVYTMSPNQWIALTPYNPTVCLGESVSITASGLTPNQYAWYTAPFVNYNPVASSFIFSGATYSFTPNQTTTLYVGGNAENGCRNFTQTTITVINPPEAIINTTNNIMCNAQGTTGTYTAQPQTAGSTYAWNITVNGVAHNAFTTSADGQSITVDWSSVYTGNYNAQICLTVSNAGCSRRTCIDVTPCCSAPGAQFIFASTNPDFFSGQHNNQTYIISGTFNANGGCTFINCNLIFMPESEIVLAFGSNLIISKSHLYACSSMWKGIKMGASSGIRIANNSLVEDAETLVSANTNCTVHIEKSIINKCGIGLDLSNFASSNCYILGAAFTCRDNVPFPTYNTNGSYISVLNSLPLGVLKPNTIGLTNNVSQIGVKTNNLQTDEITCNIVPPNYAVYPIKICFDNLEIGVYARNSSFNIFATEFNKCGDNGTSQQYVQAKRGGAVTIKTEKTPNASFMQFGDVTIPNSNTFTDCLNGIYCIGNVNLNVWKNKFERTLEKGIYLEQGTGATYNVSILKNKFIDSKNIGVHSFINNGVSLHINENRFEGANTTNALTARAVLLQEFTASNNSTFEVYNNNISEFKTSIIVENISNNSIIYDNQISMKNDNTPFDFQHGIRLVNCNAVKVINNQITASVTLNEPVRWWQDGIYNSFSPNTYIACNLINGPDVSLICQGPTPLTIVNNTFKNPNFAGYWLHTNGIAGPQGNSTTPSDNKWQYTGNIVNTYNPFQAYTNGGTIGTNSPFYYRNQNQFAFTYSGFDNTNSTPIPTGATYVASSTVNPAQCGYTPTPTYRANINNNMAKKTIKELLNVTDNVEKTYYNARKALYNTLMFDSLGIISDTIITNFKTNVANYNMGKLLEADVLIKQGLADDDSTILNQAELINNIVSAESIEQNQKEVNEIFIRYAKNNNHFNHTDKLRLKQLAALCPETEGTAVFQARTLVSKFDNSAYYNDCELIDPTITAGSTNRIIKKETDLDLSTQGISVYPNPSNGEIFIEIESILPTDNVRVDIVDNLGNNIKSVEYKDIVIYKCDVSNIVSGIYYYKIYLNNLIVKIEKLIIIK